jgi:outer membrane receptor protein involved in Fe transport
MEHAASVLYVEPFTKKFKTEVNYNFSSNETKTSKNTFDLSGLGYDVFNDLQSNNFENKRTVNRGGLKLIYDVKKYRISVGSNVRNILQENLNLTTGQKLSLSVNNVLPNAAYQYRISQGSNFSINYNASSQQPELQQMQPVIDNSDPNRISVGNPDLKPTFSHNARLNYYFYKGISDVNFWSGGNFTSTNRQISYTTYYDPLGRAVTTPINVNGNYNGNFWLGGGFPLFKKFLKLYYNLNGSQSKNISYVNNIRNISQNSSIAPGITFEKNVEKYEARLEGNYVYTIPRSNISARSNQPFYTYSIEGSVNIKFKNKFTLGTDGKYTNNGNRTPGYNLNYFIWNASVGKAFLKSERFVVSLNVNDILNQNISNQRFINSNQIVDTKTSIIKRYFLLKLLLKLNSSKVKTEDED